MNCSGCGHENPERAKFCLECGAAFAVRCESCGGELPAAAKFCIECGAAAAAPQDAAVTAQTSAPSAEGSPRAYTPRHLADKILQSKSALEGERKQVTVLFADVRNSMELADRLGPEEWHAILDRFFAILNDGVHRFEGTVNQYTGDGIMALFGAPVAHEDHAQRACHAALYVRDAVERYAGSLRLPAGLEFSVRIGINSGDVVVGRIGDDLRMDYTAQGHTVGLAQRMEQHAAPDTICLSEATARIVEGTFTLDDLGTVELKGAAESVRAFELRGMSPRRTRLDDSPAHGLSTFVGRDPEMAVLEGAFAQARAGSGQVVGIVAEAGTGKSRLCFEMVERCRTAGIRVIQGRCEPYGKNIPLLPILQVFRDYYGITEQDSDPTARQKIADGSAAFDDGYRDVLPVLFEFLGVPDPERPAPNLDPELKQRQLFAVLRMLVQQASQKTVALIEDLHWIDEPSAAWLAEWVEAVAGTGFVLVVNFRPEFEAPWLHKSYYQQIALAPLGGAAVRELLAGLLGRDPSIAGLADTIHAKTGGNPFFTEEVVQSLIESGALEGGAGDFRLGAAVETLKVPASVHAVLAARIDRLPERDKQLLQTAAVIGKDFSEPVLTRVLEEVAADGAAPGEVATVLRSLARAEFVYERTLYPVAEYSFKHPLTQEVAYGTLLRQRRARVHAAVARASAEVHVDKLDEKAALLAHHFEQAGEAWQAAQWHERAAGWAGVTNAAEGVRHWDRVRELLRPLPHTPESLQLGVTACLGSLNLGWRLGTPTQVADEIFAEGQGLAEESGDIRASAALNGTYAAVLGLVGGEMDGYLKYAREGKRLAEQTDDLGLQLAQHSFLAWACLFSGRLREGLEACTAACERLPSDPALGQEYTGYSPYLGILTARAWMHARLGDLTLASEWCDRADQLGRSFGDIEVLTWMQLPRIELDIVHQDAAAAREHARRALETGERSATPQSRFVGLMTLGIAQRLDRDWDRSVAVLEEAAEATVAGSNRMFEGWVRAELVRSLLGMGALERAEHEARTAIEVARVQHARTEEPRGHIAFALTQIERGDPAALDRVEPALASAETLIAETGAALYQPDVHELRAALARVRGDVATARAEIARAAALYTAMGAVGRAERLAREESAR